MHVIVNCHPNCHLKCSLKVPLEVFPFLLSHPPTHPEQSYHPDQLTMIHLKCHLKCFLKVLPFLTAIWSATFLTAIWNVRFLNIPPTHPPLNNPITVTSWQWSISNVALLLILLYPDTVKVFAFLMPSEVFAFLMSHPPTHPWTIPSPWPRWQWSISSVALLLTTLLVQSKCSTVTNSTLVK